MPSQIERLVSVETKLDTLTRTVEDFIKSADKKYASKTTQVIVYGLVAAIMYLFFQTNFNHHAVQTVTITTQNPDGTTTVKTLPVNSAGSGTSAAPSSTTSTTPTPTTTVTQNSSTPQESPLSKIPVVGPLFQ